MIFGVSPTKDAVVIAQTTGSGETFVIKSIKSIQFQARSGDDLTALLQRLVVTFDRGGKRRRSTIALLGSSSGRFKSSIEAIKAEAITELAAAGSGLPVVRVTAASLKKVLGCAMGQDSGGKLTKGAVFKREQTMACTTVSLHTGVGRDPDREAPNRRRSSRASLDAMTQHRASPTQGRENGHDHLARHRPPRAAARRRRFLLQT